MALTKAFQGRKLQKVALLGLLSLGLAGCMVGPDFQKPPAPTEPRYTELPLPKKTAAAPGAGKAGVAQQFVQNQNIPGKWWELFHSPELNELMSYGVANNASLQALEASLRQGEEVVKAAFGNLLLPAINGSMTDFTDEFTNGSNTVFNAFSIAANVSYNFDIFGGSRRQIQSLQEQVNFEQFRLLAGYMTLTSDIATTAILAASLRAQIKATQKLIKAEEDQLNIIKSQYQLGGVADTNVLSQQSLVDQTKATLPPLEQSLANADHLLSVLVGSYTDKPLPHVSLDSLVLPEKLPVTVPSQWVRQRPDVRASEALWHAASAQIGVATANMFPSFNIAGDYGWTHQTPANFFEPTSVLWHALGQITQPIFHGGALLAQRRAAIDAYEEAGAVYRYTLLHAFRNVADALSAVDEDAKTLQAQKAAEVSAYETLKITQQQFVLGGVSYLNVLSAQQSYQKAVLSLIKAEASRYSDTATLFVAMGGGWWNHKAITKQTKQGKTLINLIPVTLEQPD